MKSTLKSLRRGNLDGFYYAVIDTNVIISAMLKWDSVPGSVVQFCLDGLIIPVYNEDMISEYRDVLSREKFHLDKQTVDDFLNMIIEKGIKIEAETLEIKMPDPSDKKFYEVVMEERKKEDSYLVTGNIKHFPQMKFIVTSREMLNIIIKDNFG